MVPFPGPSHWILLQEFAKELLLRGHEVTAIVNKPINNFKSPNYTEILIDKPFNLSSVCKCTIKNYNNNIKINIILNIFHCIHLNAF